ncbi:hypothetical protein [Pedobacter caeni]|uniref:DUF4836 domain-containing protein n=1 Tax=Pedobacter caeni TaxID=288992 RepID=A0A1M4VRY6_9SPHI|nr:hypothetical protein [Pedobacter caeni]SHE71583.1 hypothetical protein SAMN04488522_101996 [Pedobacter caeni]
MNYFFKSAITGAFLLGTLSVNAQDLVRKIPADAMAVATIKGNNFLELMSVEEFNSTFFGKEMFKKLKEEQNKSNYASVEDFGFNLASSFYYYNQTNDSVSYNCFLAPVKNAAQLDKLFGESGKKIITNGKQRTFFNADSTKIARWDDEMFLMVLADGRSAYFDRPEIRQRFGMSVLELPQEAVSVDSTATVTDATMDVTNVEPAVEEPKQKVRSKKKSSYQSKSKKTKGKGKKTAKKSNRKKPVVRTVPVEEPMVEYATADAAADAAVAVADSAYSSVEYQDSPYYKDKIIQKSIVARWSTKILDEAFAGTNQGSILKNADFVKNTDPKAEATIWLAGVEKLANAYMPATPYFKGFNFLSGYGSANAKLYLEEKSIRISSAMTFGNEMGSVLRKIQQRKLNKTFLKYVNEDKLIGYMAYAIDTKAYLQEYPKLVSQIYGSMYADEIGMATDLFSLVIDEEAISKVVKGDVMFVFNGLSQKEVSYKSYDYNEENFETTEVMKTKKETLPDFLAMISTEDTRLLNKLITYGVKKEVVKSKNSYYELSIPKSPLALYFAIKDGIIFIGTNGTEMEQIVSNTYQAKVSGRHKTALLGNNYAAYFSPKRLAGKIPAEELGSPSKVEKANKTLNALGDIYMKSYPMNSNTFSGEISMDTPADQKNSLKYLFSVMESLK